MAREEARKTLVSSDESNQPQTQPGAFPESPAKGKEKELYTEESRKEKPRKPTMSEPQKLDESDIKIPKPPMFSGEGADLKPEAFTRWTREVRMYLLLHDINNNNAKIATYYALYLTGKAKEVYFTLIDNGNPTLEELKDALKQRFQSSTNTEDLYKTFYGINQVKQGKMQRISMVISDLEMYRGRLPTGTISDFAMRQRLMDAMHTLLRQRVEPYINDGETWTDIIKTAERCDSILFRTGAYGQSKKTSDNK